MHASRDIGPREAILEEMKSRLLDRWDDQIDRIVLYGSRATGDAGPYNDFDLLVVCRNGLSRRDARRRFRDALGELRPLADLRVVTREQFQIGRDVVGCLVEVADRSGRTLHGDEQSGPTMAPDWWSRALDDLRAAEILLEDGAGAPWVIAYHAQQSVEKGIKAYLVGTGCPPADRSFRVHEIDDLRTLVSEHDRTLAESLSDADPLGDFAVEAR